MCARVKQELGAPRWSDRRAAARLPAPKWSPKLRHARLPPKAVSGANWRRYNFATNLLIFRRRASITLSAGRASIGARWRAAFGELASRRAAKLARKLPSCQASQQDKWPARGGDSAEVAGWRLAARCSRPNAALKHCSAADCVWGRRLCAMLQTVCNAADCVQCCRLSAARQAPSPRQADAFPETLCGRLARACRLEAPTKRPPIGKLKIGLALPKRGPHLAQEAGHLPGAGANVCGPSGPSGRKWAGPKDEVLARLSAARPGELSGGIAANWSELGSLGAPQV